MAHGLNQVFAMRPALCARMGYLLLLEMPEIVNLVLKTAHHLKLYLAFILLYIYLVFIFLNESQTK